MANPRKKLERAIEALTGRSMVNSDAMTMRVMSTGSKKAKAVNEKLTRGKKIADRAKKAAGATVITGGVGAGVLAANARKNKK